MNWPDRKDMPGILIVAVMLAAIVYFSIFQPGLIKITNYGFGPEWECMRMEKGGPICFKRAPQEPQGRVAN